MKQAHTRRKSCRGCDSEALRHFLDLGSQPLANAFLGSREDFGREARYPLAVYFCEGCSLVQLIDVIDPELLFRNYIYLTGTSETMAAHNRKYAASVVELLGLGPDDLVVEIASNDGSLLQQFKAHGVQTLGFEPAANIAAMARKSGVETRGEFFNLAGARNLREERGPARAVIANNVLAHVDDTREFLQAGRHLLSAGGLMIMEVPYLGEFLQLLEYDTVYHEHLCYFSISSLLHLCSTVGLSVLRIDRIPVHGGSIRIYAGTRESWPEHAAEVILSGAGEAAAGMTSITAFEDFAGRVETSREELTRLLRELRAEGKTVAGYGAPAKGNTLLNYCRIGTDLLPFIVDKSPLKTGLFTPGMHIPVLPLSAVAENEPDFLLILAWNFAEEIMRQQEDFRVRGGRFIIPLPEPRIV